MASRPRFPLRLPRFINFLIRQDRRGAWVVREQHDRCGGIFVEKADALRFALQENGNCRDAVCFVSDDFGNNVSFQLAHSSRVPFEDNRPDGSKVMPC
jgi:hypothetical protein